MPLSETQMRYLALAWQCFESEPKIDYEKFHQVAGLKSIASAREMMRVTKKKLAEELGGEMGASTPSTPKKGNGEGGVAKTPASSRKKGTAKKRGKADVDDDEDAVEESAAKKAKVKQEKIEDDEDADGDALS